MRKSSELTFKRPEVCRDSGGAETVIQNGVYNGIIALNVIVDGEREVRHPHAMMSVDDWMDARKAGQALERFVKALHKMRDNPIAATHIEVLGLNEVELGQGGKSNALHVSGRYGVRQGGLSPLSNHRRGLYLIHKEPYAVRAHVHARPGACSRLRTPQVPSRDSPLSGSSRRKSCCRSLARRAAWSSFLSDGKNYSIIPYRGGNGLPCGGEGILHRWHRCGLRPTQRYTDGKTSVLSVSVEDGISVISGSRMAGRRFTTEHTERATPVTEYTEGVETEETWLSVYSVCRRRRVQCVCGGLKPREGLPLRHARSHGRAGGILCRAAFC